MRIFAKRTRHCLGFNGYQWAGMSPNQYCPPGDASHSLVIFFVQECSRDGYRHTSRAGEKITGRSGPCSSTCAEIALRTKQATRRPKLKIRDGLDTRRINSSGSLDTSIRPAAESMSSRSSLSALTRSLKQIKPLLQAPLSAPKESSIHRSRS